MSVNSSPAKPCEDSCVHPSIFTLNSPSELSFCNMCNFGFYKNTTIIRPLEKAQKQLPKELPTFRCAENLPISEKNLTNETESNPGYSFLKFREKMMRQLFDRVDIMQLNKESRYLATYLQDYFFSGELKNSQRQPMDIGKIFLKWDLYSAAALLLSSKVREVDNQIPYASEVKRFHDNFW